MSIIYHSMKAKQSHLLLNIVAGSSSLLLSLAFVNKNFCFI